MRSIAFDAPHGADTKRIAFVRLTAPALPWRSNGADAAVSYPSETFLHPHRMLPTHVCRDAVQLSDNTSQKKSMWMHLLMAPALKMNAITLTRCIIPNA